MSKPRYKHGGVIDLNHPKWRHPGAPKVPKTDTWYIDMLTGTMRKYVPLPGNRLMALVWVGRDWPAGQ